MIIVLKNNKHVNSLLLSSLIQKDLQPGKNYNIDYMLSNTKLGYVSCFSNAFSYALKLGFQNYSFIIPNTVDFF